MKVCTKCKREQPFAQFDISKPGMHRTICKDCVSIYNNSNYTRRAEEIKTKVKAYRASLPDSYLIGLMVNKARLTTKKGRQQLREKLIQKPEELEKFRQEILKKRQMLSIKKSKPE